MTAKQAAYQAVHRALRAGTLGRQPCRVCGMEPTEAHYVDYARPLEVVWLCSPHHYARHGKWCAAPRVGARRGGRPALSPAERVARRRATWQASWARRKAAHALKRTEPVDAELRRRTEGPR